MQMPSRIGGPKEDKPALIIAVGKSDKPKPRMPTRIGGPKEYEREEPEEDEGGERMSAEEALTDACTEMIRSVNGSMQSLQRFKAAFKAACMACDSMPHEEGEHLESEGDEIEEGEG